MGLTLRDAKVGDWVRFASGRNRRVEARWKGGLSFVQVANGVVASAHWKQVSLADGRKLTSYTWSDLARAGAELVTAC